MTEQERIKYAYELMVKNNPDEAVKTLIMLEKENNNLKEDFKRHIDRINELQQRIDKAIEYITNGWDFKSIYFKKTDEELWKILLEDNIKNDLLDILRGEDNENNSCN